MDIGKTQSAGQPEPPLPQCVTPRAVAIACALMPVLALWVVNSEFVWWNGATTAISLFMHVVFPLFFLALLNIWLENRFPRLALSPGELMTIYVMLSVAGTLCSHDFIQILFPELAYPAFAANPQNRWGEIILPYLKEWAVILDKDTCTAMALGNASIYSWDVMAALARPMLFWSAFILLLMFALVCLNVLLRKQWIEQERLAFPVIQIPLAIATDLRSLLANRYFWIAFAIAGGVDILNGIQFFIPSLPKIPTEDAFKFREYLLERPWNAIGTTTLSIYPFAIGLAFFLPTDLAFSCWFFFVLFKLEMIWASWLGISDLPGFPFPNEQAAGGYLGLGVFALWVSRRHLLAVCRTALGRPGGLDDSEEPVRYRTALLGLAACFVLLVAAGTSLGSSPGMMTVFFIMFFLYALAIGRMRAELGPPAHDLHNCGPDKLLVNFYGTRGLDSHQHATLSLFFWFNRAYRAHFSAHGMEAYKIAQISRMTSRAMTGAMVIAILVGLLSAFWGTLHNIFVYGYSGRLVGDAYSSEAWNQMAANVSLPQAPRIAATLATTAGFFVTLLLGALRMKFTWWLWHPVGYATCSSWSMEKLWFCIFTAWLIKLLITRYGGARIYRKSLPFFIGLVLGEFIIGNMWSIIGGIMGIPVYRIWG